MAKRKVLVTGGAGFIGVNLIRLLLKERPDWEIVNFDLLTYAGNLASLTDVENNPRYTFIRGDVADPAAVDSAMNGSWGVMHLAAESHVDRSIEDSGPFLKTNVLGTQVILDTLRKHQVERFLLVSTDEVYGSLSPTDPPFTEQNNLLPNSPYSASKASSDLLARAYHKTFNAPVVITRCSDNYGPYQFPEKLIPLVIKNALSDKAIPVYGDGQQIRDWLFVEDHCRALLAALEQGIPGEVYNVGGGNEIANIDLIKLILRELDKPESLIKFVEDRLGHDRRYAIDSEKVSHSLGWMPRYSFQEALPKTVAWYRKHEDWIQTTITGEYLNYYSRQYSNR